MEYEIWGTHESGSPHLKPVALGLLGIALVCGLTAAFLRWTNDPARKWDKTPLVATSKPEPVPAPALAPAPAPAPAAEPIGGEEEYGQLVEQARQERRRVKKVNLLRQALAVFPRGDEALALLSTLLMELPKTRGEALDLARRAVEINPDNGAAWLVIGYVNQLGGNRAQAREAYRRCAASSGPARYVRECRQLG